MKSLIIAVLVSSSLIVVSDAADAAGEETAALWQRFGGWCAIAEWQPAVKKCEETKEGNDVFRTLTLGDGGKIKEKLLDRTPTSYRYAIIKSPLPVKNYEAQFSIVADDDHADEVNIVWAATYDAADGKNEKDARSLVDGSFKDGIASIKAKLGDKASGKPATLDCARYMPTAGITVAVPCDQ